MRATASCTCLPWWLENGQVWIAPWLASSQPKGSCAKTTNKEHRGRLPTHGRLQDHHSDTKSKSRKPIRVDDALFWRIQEYASYAMSRYGALAEALNLVWTFITRGQDQKCTFYFWPISVQRLFLSKPRKCQLINRLASFFQYPATYLSPNSEFPRPTHLHSYPPVAFSHIHTPPDTVTTQAGHPSASFESRNWGRCLFILPWLLASSVLNIPAC
ncbi:hypothetical protein J3458_022437 [Metarhizium acridum]|uniref:uncharacterized protein n=1 Tax=Metarhizium acridum TaxID=92637 RepID=UPI001C6B994B|nr:hypothetical protein J3458_022437 [Metarhizium acridum]